MLPSIAFLIRNNTIRSSATLPRLPSLSCCSASFLVLSISPFNFRWMGLIPFPTASALLTQNESDSNSQSSCSISSRRYFESYLFSRFTASRSISNCFDFFVPRHPILPASNRFPCGVLMPLHPVNRLPYQAGNGPRYNDCLTVPLQRLRRP